VSTGESGYLPRCVDQAAERDISGVPSGDRWVELGDFTVVVDVVVVVVAAAAVVIIILIIIVVLITFDVSVYDY
jgi:hypothetical protein